MHELLGKVIDELRGSWRFRGYALATAWVLSLIGWAAVFAMPDMYRASARIFVDTRAALGIVLQGLTIQQDVNAQLNLVRQSLLSRPQLDRIARETDLDLRANTPGERLALIEDMTERINLSVMETGAGGVVYTIEYDDPDQQASLAVVDRLVSTFVEDTLGGKRAGSEVAQKFLREQIDEYEQRLREAEERLADFKKRNVGLMPGAQGDYFSRLQAEMAEVAAARTELSIALTRRDELARQLRGEASVAALEPPVVPGAPADTTSTTARIRETETRLQDLLLQYTERHPDVIALREVLAQLEARRKAELEALRQGDGVLPAGAAASPVVQSIQLALNRADVEIAALRTRISDGERRVAELRRLVDTAPEVEAEFARLNRDYDVTRERYTDLVDRAERAKLGDEAEETDAVRFEVIDPPAVSPDPVAPRRPLMLAAVFIMSIGAGCGLAFLLHQLRPVFNSARALTDLTGLPVLGVVSTAWLERCQAEQRRQYIFYLGGAALLLLTFVALLQLQPLAVSFAQRLIG